LYLQLVKVAKRKTAEADVRFDDRGRKIDEQDFGDHVLIVKEDDGDPEELLAALSNGNDPQRTLF